MSDLDSVFETNVEVCVAKAVELGRPLVVFATDLSESSNQWVKAVMGDSEQLLQDISDKAVALKLVKDSVQFKYFEEIFPGVKVPSFYCIKVAVILDVIFGDVSQEEFAERIGKVLSQGSAGAGAGSAGVLAVPASPARVVPPVTAAAGNSGQQHPQREKKSLKQQNAELAAQRYKQEQLAKKHKDAEERQRIKMLLKKDEQERMAQNREERQRRLSNQMGADNVITIDQLNKRQKQPTPANHDNCALLIRLLDGSSISHEFKIHQTLNDVRKWLDQNRTDSDEPYCFHRSIPRVTFGVTDEEKTLESLELAPRSALILKPFRNYSKAQNVANDGLISKMFKGISSYWYGSKTGTESHAHTPGSPVTEQPPPLHPQQENNALNLSHPSSGSLNLNAEPQQTTVNHSAVTHSRVDSPDIFSQMHDSNQPNI